jgi:hypothetical protein
MKRGPALQSEQKEFLQAVAEVLESWRRGGGPSELEANGILEAWSRRSAQFSSVCHGSTMRAG